MKRLFFVSFIVLFALQPLVVVQAQEFVVDPEYLVSDSEMLDIYSMSLKDVERFLIRGALDEYIGSDVNGEENRLR